ncbi:hypothetical protein VTN77DRAFT_2976 [Rasamsonia byssochlamydoides]|uniref:uncharacterized protein n=1 Tax=Rasamsonia byssochlamydoides TaxID=89139 RepID=UPI0037427A99
MASDTGYRLRRAKSAPSVQKRRQAPLPPEPLDPEVAKRHAMAAASHAMAQARERSSHGSRGSGDQPGGDEKPAHFSIPQRRRPSGIRFTDDDRPVSQMSVASISTPAPRAVNHSSENDPSVDLPSIREFQGLECETPSSYRRLRKARSMFSTRHRGGTVAPKSPKEMNSVESQPDAYGGSEHNRTLRHSMSFFHGNDPSAHGLRRIKSQNAAVQLAHSQYLEDQETGMQQERRPSLLSRRNRYEQKPFRKTFRTTREMSPDDDDASPAGTRWSSGTGLQMKARAFSITIKKRLKRVFGRSQFTEEHPPEPRPHASPSNFGDYVANRWDMQSQRQDATGLPPHSQADETPNGYTFGQIVSDENRPPTLRTMRSSESIATSVSRVTSWTDSTAGNTVTTRHTADRTRLSIIQEYGDSDRRYSDDYDNNSAACPKRTPTVQHVGRSIDSQRVYSALMKRINQAAAKDGEKVVSAGTVKERLPVPERASSICSQYSNCSIRHTASDLSMKTARTSFGTELQLQNAQSRSPLRPDYSGNKCSLSQSPSVRRKASLREPESTFFPSTSYAKPKTPSPYRLAMNSIRESEDHSEDETGSVVVSKTVDPGSASDSPSVYSRTTSGHVASQENLGLDSDSFEPPQPGMATIFTSNGTPYNSPKKAGSLRLKPSTEWKSWMNSQINKIDDFESLRLSKGPWSRDHYREETQIDGETQQASAADSLPISASGDDRRASLQRAKEGNTSRNVSDRSPLMELKIPAQSNFSRPLSRQTTAPVVVPARSSPSNSLSRCSYQESGSHPSSRFASNPDRFSFAKSNESIENPESPTPRRSLRAAREARLHRSPVARSTIRAVVDKDARAVQFRSIRSGRFTNENTRHDMESAEMHKQLQGIHSTIDSKRMVDLFLSSRRVQRGESEDGGTVFL